MAAARGKHKHFVLVAHAGWIPFDSVEFEPAQARHVFQSDGAEITLKSEAILGWKKVR